MSFAHAVQPIRARNPLSRKATSVPFCQPGEGCSKVPQQFHSSINGRGSHVVIVLLQPCVIIPPSLAASLRELGSRILAEEVQFPYFAEGRAELLNAESVNDGVDR